MKFKLFVLSVLMLFVVGCTVVPPGEVGIKVNRLGDTRGVQDLTLSTGLVTYFPGWSTVFSYPTFMQTATWQKHNEGDREANNEIVFNTKDGMVVSGDVSLSYQLTESKVPAFYVKFRTDNLETFTHGFLYNVARDAFNEVASVYSVEEIYGAKKEEYLTAVRKRVNTHIEPYGVNIQQFGFLGKIRVPNAVEDSINAKIKATQDAQRVENEIREAKANAEKKIADATGISKANTLLASSISEQLIKWEQLQIQKAQISKWNGAYPYFLASGGGQNTPFLINVPAGK
jgi:regulator of protease activity HflC (stomatin/prohibitin superfamily)